MAFNIPDILFQDSDIIVINKPPGMLSVPGKGEGQKNCLTYRIRSCFPESIEQPAVHRLDMDTSGLMVFALTRSSHRNLSIQFQSRSVLKEYTALLDGETPLIGGEICLSFRLDPENRPRQIWDPEQGKKGITRWKRLGAASGRTRVLFYPLTGRTHQLRLHAYHPLGLGIPIYGDRLYGRGCPGEFLSLHSSRLVFCHPVTGKIMDFHRNPVF